MKNILLITFLCVILTSCDKGENLVEKDANFQGRWSLSHVELINAKDIDGYSQFQINEEIRKERSWIKLTIDADGTGKAETRITTDGYYGDRIKEYSKIGKYSFNEDSKILIVKDFNGGFEFFESATVISLNDNRMELEYPYDDYRIKDIIMIRATFERE